MLGFGAVADGSVADSPAAGNKVDYTLDCDAGSYSYSGIAAQIPVTRNLALDVGAYAYTGIDALVPVSRNLSGDTGAYSYAGSDAAIPVSRQLAGDAGAYAYAGSDATLDYVPGAGAIDYTLICDAGSYLLVGSDAILDYLPGTAVSTAMGGWASLQRKRRKTEDEIKAERIALGILPAEVAKIANKVAQKAIKAATAKQVPDVMDWTQQAEQQALYERQLRMEMARRKQIWQAAYAQLFDLAVQEALQAEEEMVLMLLMEL